MDNATKQELVDAIRSGNLAAIRAIIPSLGESINTLFYDNPEEPYTIFDLAITRADSRGLTDEQRTIADKILENMASNGAATANFLLGDEVINSMNPPFADRAAAETNAYAAAAVAGAGGAAMTGAEIAAMFEARIAALHANANATAAPATAAPARAAPSDPLADARRALKIYMKQPQTVATMRHIGRLRRFLGEQVIENRRAKPLTPLGESLAVSGIAGNGRTRARVRLGGRRKRRTSKKRKSRISRK